MRKSVGLALCAGVFVCALPASATVVTLTAGRVAKFKNPSGASSDKAIVKFVSDPNIVPPFPSPICPSTSFLRITSDTQTIGPIALPCALWQLTSSGYIYKDSGATAGGIQKILFQTRTGKVLIKLKGANYGTNAVGGPVAFVEVELGLDSTTSYCGRFEAPPSTQKKNTAEMVMYKGPSTACILPTPTATDTPLDTPTPTETFTQAPSATATATGTSTSTRTFTRTPTATATATATGGTPGPTSTPGPQRAFRLDSVSLKDPHAYNPSSCPGVFDITGVANLFIASALTADSNPADGNYDLSLLAVFPNLNQPPSPGGNIDVRTGICTANTPNETCGPDTSPLASTTYFNQSSGTCVAPMAGTTGPGNVAAYAPPVDSALAPCAGSVPTTISFPLGVFTIPLQDVQVGATYVGTPATNLINGIVKGFISETDANALILPPTTPVVGGQPLSALFAGGTGSCTPFDDRDVGPGSVLGWYIYINFTAHQVTWTGP